ncbi:MAG: UTP--glucose-1-phosphate uridylyltransferase GalU [Gammaproteobacteria bacterium]|nr:UTP--glucose-1-phosphate uridylyltransferase GalU [Gammaproteobacteria bacterium]MBT4606378.1 UTP--glucose-1-phosphate uridylyltransferase GalU [Thiotrichales bacterium]MBT3472692.1 UTP--glucose-1-phosphate uridylyltransferase GalU [Gammaproteobacteria bacterium]MBT3967367.1 UTP--glucose-1-phosphate uridylyltransferase GalU [Gammaproteobacteria bacterium]MBT4081504.1 UTP--glucose-1-phosphate uridylyltransferase GalU [Gammaproteobacteria bacterium]
MMKITKYVLPVAGLGTRFLPATKAIPKEMLTVVDKPLIQYIVEEAVEAGAEQIILVTHASKRALEDHFDKMPELERVLEEKGKQQLLEKVRSIIPEHVEVIAVRQPEPLGLGHAVLCAAPVVGDAPFAVMLPDVLIHNSPGCMAQLVELFETQGSSIIGVENVAREEVNKYGIVSLQPDEQGALQRMSGVVEKPTPEQAPSTLSVVGRYILTPKVMELLRETESGAGGEIQLTDAIATLITQEPVYAYTFKGSSYDCGHKMGFVQANLEYALRDPEISAELEQQIQRLAK